MDKKEDKKLLLITEISCENGKKYFLYNDGNLYEKLEDGTNKKLDRLNKSNKEIIDKIMERLKPGRTDVVRDENER